MLAESVEADRHLLAESLPELKKIFKGYSSYEVFISTASESEIKRAIALIDFEEISKRQAHLVRLFGSVSYSKSALDEIKTRFLNLSRDNKKNNIGGKMSSCDDTCTIYASGVWWDSFWYNQNVLNYDLYTANTYATIARAYAYSGCMYGCNNNGNEE